MRFTLVAVKRFSAFPLLCVLALSAGCSKKSTVKTSEIAVKVGDAVITKEMVELRMKTLSSHPMEVDLQMVALGQLIQGQLSSEVLRRYDHEVTDGTLRIAWQNVRPNVSKPVSDVAATILDEKLLLETLVRPDVAALEMEEFFHHTPELFKQQSDNMKLIHDELLRRPELIDEIASRENLPIERMWFGPKSLRSDLDSIKGKIDRRLANTALKGTKDPRKYSDEEIAQAADFYKRFAEVKAGDVYPKPLDTPEAFQIFRIEERKKDEIRVAILTLPKPSIDDWFWREVQNIPVAFPDRNTGLEFMKSIPWGRILNVNKDQYPEVFGAAGAPLAE